MKRNKNKKHHRQLLVTLIHILILSTLISYITCNIVIYHGVSVQFNRDTNRIVNNIIKMADNNIPPNNIAEIASTNMYPVKVVNGLNEYNLTTKEYTNFVKNGITKFKSNPLYNSVLLQKNGTVYEISVNHNTNDFMTTLLRLSLGMIIAFIISVIIIIIASNSMIKPLRDLSKATIKISKGDFKVRVKGNKNPEIENLAENFNTMAQELDKMETLSNDFIRNVSHEFKTPVSSICGFAELLKQSSLSPQQKEYAEIINTEALRLSKLTTSILNLSKLENQNISTDKQSFYIDEQLRQCILLLEKKWVEKDITLDLHLDKAEYHGNKPLTENIWINLIDNAIKFTDNNGKISVKCSKNDNNITVSVKDNGIGMNKDVVERIFDKFYQGDKSHSAEGSGLGLSIVKRIIDISNGSISIKSTPGKGSTFVVNLPIDEQ